MHNPTAVDGLITAYENTKEQQLKTEILTTLARLYKKETPFNGATWWGTRPDTHGPYYNPVTWESSGKIKNLLMKAYEDKTVADNTYFSNLNKILQLDIDAFDQPEQLAAENALKDSNIDLDAITSKKAKWGTHLLKM